MALEPHTPPPAKHSLSRPVNLVEHHAHSRSQRTDQVVAEEPMEIRVVFGPDGKRSMRSVSVTMRTPGHDEELAAGFLFTEGLLTDAGQIEQIGARGTGPDGQPTGNVVRVLLKPEVGFNSARLECHFFATSSCGVCGKASLEALEVQGLAPLAGDGFAVAGSALRALPDRLRERQIAFEQTGGLHGAGLFGTDGELVLVREDVGRHNAVDKLLGRCFLDGRTPLHRYGMIVSGRVSFEIMQKALAAGIPLVAAVGAPSSLAVEMAEHYNMTLAGFLSATRFNVYSAGHRIV